jgi:hypothetical protein
MMFDELKLTDEEIDKIELEIFFGVPERTKIKDARAKILRGVCNAQLKKCLEALKAKGIDCRCVASAFFMEDGGNSASWYLATRHDGKKGKLLFIPDESQEGKG